MAREINSTSFWDLLNRAGRRMPSLRKLRLKSIWEGSGISRDSGGVLIQPYYLRSFRLALSMLGKQDLMLEKQDAMLQKQDLMIEKQDETINVIREESSKTRSEIRVVSSKLDKTNELLENRFEKLEEEIKKIKEALIRAGIEI